MSLTISYTQTNTQPRFMYNRTEIVRRQHAISIDDIRDLIIHIVADGPPPNWLRIDNANTIQKVVALLVPGLTPDLLSLPPIPTSATQNPNLPLSIPLLPRDPTAPTTSLVGHIPFIATTFTNACPTRAPGDQTRMHSVLSSFFNGPISGEEKKRRMTMRAQSEITKDNPSQYLLSLEQMIENSYPIPSYMAGVFEKPPGWVETPAPNPNENKWKQKIYAIDCEMCTTEDGKELTRVCLIDYSSGIVVYDQLVKPQKPILDYLTKYSGITQEQLAPVTTTLAQVQEHILRLLTPPAPNPFSSSDKQPTEPPPATAILLGHSLESDLNALKLCHPKCIDTAVIYHHPRGRPLKPALKWLTKKWINRDIQTRGEGGHDPEEDARACLDLLKKKVECGPGFGEFKMDYESIFERMSRATGRSGRMGGTGSVKSAVVDHGNPATMHGLKATTCIACKSDDEVVEGVLNVVPSHQFVFGRLTGLANVLGWITPKPSPDSPLPTPQTLQSTVPPPVDAPTLTPALHALNTHLKSIHASLPSRTALIIFTGHSDPRKMSLLNQRKSAFENGLKSGRTPEEMRGEGVVWSASDARELEEGVELARRGLMFLGVK
ncbi:ribonuclease H [Panaeolus papilionaceus]|nr:ribonuclease H [Panaeolus papilionaceus]